MTRRLSRARKTTLKLRTRPWRSSLVAVASAASPLWHAYLVKVRVRVRVRAGVGAGARVGVGAEASARARGCSFWHARLVRVWIRARARARARARVRATARARVDPLWHVHLTNALTNAVSLSCVVVVCAACGGGPCSTIPQRLQDAGQ